MVAEPLSKQLLIDLLCSTGNEAAARLRSLLAEAYMAGRYENGWNAREILAHIAAIEWTYGRLIDVAREAPATGAPPAGTVRRTEAEEAAGLATRTARGGIDDYNARQVAKRAEASVPELIEEFVRNRASTISAVEAADDALLQRPIRSAGGITGRLADVLRAVAVEHVMMHVSDITGEPWQGRRW